MIAPSAPCAAPYPALRKAVLRHFDVIEGNRSGAGHLHLLVTLAGDEHDVAGLGFVDRQRDGFAPVRFQGVFAYRCAASPAWRRS